jgi:hypothetical protein
MEPFGSLALTGPVLTGVLSFATEGALCLALLALLASSVVGVLLSRGARRPVHERRFAALRPRLLG